MIQNLKRIFEILHTFEFLFVAVVVSINIFVSFQNDVFFGLSVKKEDFTKKHCINVYSKILFTDHSQCSQQGSVYCNPPLSLNSLSEKTTLFKHVTTKQLEDIPIKALKHHAPPPNNSHSSQSHGDAWCSSITSQKLASAVNPFTRGWSFLFPLPRGWGGGNPKITFSCRPTSRNPT